jgi:hypothetical protein
LLNAAEEAALDLLLTTDRRIRYQQNLAGRKIAIGGIVLTEKVDDVESWESVLDANRHEPDPARLDRFLADLPDDNMKKQLAKWKG